ncbi:unnamed protein product [Gadus morhua 'NCC']
MRLARSRENTKREEQKTTTIMVHWQDEEIRQLLRVRAKAEISRQIVGTARDSVVYDQITKGLREKGIIRTKAQVNTKLKALKKQYQTFVDRRGRSGNGDETWCYLGLCEAIWGSSHSPRPVALGLGQEMASTSRSTETSSPSTPEPPSSDNDEKPSVADLSIKDSGCSTEWTVPDEEPPRKKSRNKTNLERQSAEVRRVFNDMDKDFHERERLRLLEEREYEERWRREQQEREDRRHREEMAVLQDMTTVLRQMAQAQQLTADKQPPPLPSGSHSWSPERIRRLEERDFMERRRREEQERENRERREEMAVLKDLTSTLRQMTQARQVPAAQPPPLPPVNNPWSPEQLQLLQE